MEQLTYEMPTLPALLTPAESLLEQAREIVIDSPDMAQMAAAERSAINSKIKQREAERLEIVRKIDAAKDPVNALFKRPVAILREALAIFDDKIIAWNRLQERARREAQAKIEETARKEQEALMKRAATAEAKGQTEKAAVLTETAAAIPAAIVLPAHQKLDGTHEVKRYRAEVVDKMRLVQFVAANPQFINALDPNTTALNALARSMKEAFNVDGCRVVVDTSLASRAA